MGEMQEWRAAYVKRLIERGCPPDLAQEDCDAQDDSDIDLTMDPEDAADDTISYMMADSDFDCR